MGIDDNQLAREAVLARVRAALGREGPDDEARAAAHAYLTARAQGPRPSLPDDLVWHFEKRATDMSSTVERIASLDAVPAAVARYLGARDAGRSASAQTVTPARERADVADAARLEAVNVVAGGGAPKSGDASVASSGVCWPEFSGLDWTGARLAIQARPTTGQDELGITGCYCAIAETGTLVFVTGEDTPSATFLLPETHVAVVRASQIVAGMEDAFARVRAAGAMPRAVNLVSGPSRTGDIEQTIVLGAHGPRYLHIPLMGSMGSEL
jgi:L-lactate dehydrogenase complex protein LldG